MGHAPDPQADLDEGGSRQAHLYDQQFASHTMTHMSDDNIVQSLKGSCGSSAMHVSDR